MKKIKTILIGLGKVGFLGDLNKHNSISSHAKVLYNLKEIDFLCAVDKLKKNRILFKKKYKIEVSSNIEKSIKKYKPEFIVISTDTNNLFKVLKKVGNYNCVKNILVEKPGANNFICLKKIINTFEKKKINLFLNYNRSYNNKIVNLFSLLKSKKYFKATYFYNRGFLNNCSHFLNIFFLYLSDPIKITIIKKNKKFMDDIQPDVKLNFKNGEIFLICNGNNKILHNELIIFNNNFKINSNSSLSSFLISKLKKNQLIAGFNDYFEKKKIHIKKKNYQEIVYKKILNKNSRNNDILYSGLKVLKLYNNIKIQYKKF